MKRLVSSDPAAEDHYGYGVAIDGDTIVVGVKWVDDDGTNSGSAYVYDRHEGGEIDSRY